MRLAGPPCRAHHIDLLGAATIGFKRDLRAVGRIGRRRVDRRPLGQTGGGARAQVHRVEIGARPVGERHDDLLSVRRKARREGHARKIADRLALSGLEVEQRHLGIAAPERHVGKLLRGRRELRRDDKLFAAVEIFDVGAVHVHDREALAALLLRAGLVDKHDPRIEKSLLAGHARKYGVGDHVRDAARVGRIGRILLARDLFAGRRVPQTELRGHAPGLLMQHPSGQHELRGGRLPCIHVGGRVWIGDRFGKVRWVERQKEDRAREIGGHDAADLVACLLASEWSDSDGHRFKIGAGMNIDVALGDRGRARKRNNAEREGCNRVAARYGTKRHSSGIFQDDDNASTPEIIERRLRDRSGWSWFSIAHKTGDIGPAPEAGCNSRPRP